MRALIHLCAVPFVCALSMPANAQLLEQKALSAAMAMTIAQVAIDTCKTNGYRVSVSIVGRAGELLLQVRGDNTGPHTMENSFRKAYTSRTFRIPSGEMTKRLKDNPTLGTVHLSNIIALAGALCARRGAIVCLSRIDFCQAEVVDALQEPGVVGHRLVVAEDVHALELTQRAHNLRVHPWNRRQLARPVRLVVRPRDPRRFVLLPFGRHTSAERELHSQSAASLRSGARLVRRH